tara:strand:+ start:159 stop:455 length:297 start_codon:yes stop_codon:yes gene_type:complete
MRKHLNNMVWIENKAHLSNEWADREFVLGHQEEGWFVFCNMSGDVLSFEDDQEYFTCLETLNDCLNKLNENNRVFIQRDKDMARPIQNYPFSDQCGAY